MKLYVRFLNVFTFVFKIQKHDFLVFWVAAYVFSNTAAKMLFCTSAISLYHYSREKYSGPQTEALSGERQRRQVGWGMRRGDPSPAD